MPQFRSNGNIFDKAKKKTIASFPSLLVPLMD